jgi:hypothetical protein
MSEPVRKPTEVAELLFNRAAATAFNGYAPRGPQKGISPADHAMVLESIAAGLQQMAVGLRATYMVVEQITAKLQQVRKGLMNVIIDMPAKPPGTKSP